MVLTAAETTDVTSMATAVLTGTAVTMVTNVLLLVHPELLTALQTRSWPWPKPFL
jgi:hypothetical protein